MLEIASVRVDKKAERLECLKWLAGPEEGENKWSGEGKKSLNCVKTYLFVITEAEL